MRASSLAAAVSSSARVRMGRRGLDRSGAIDSDEPERLDRLRLAVFEDFEIGLLQIDRPGCPDGR